MTSNADLYNTMTPPAYTLSVASSEVAIEATAYEQEKLHLHNDDTPPYRNNPESPRAIQADSHPVLHIASGTEAPDRATSDSSGHFTAITSDAALAHLRKCSVLPDRPAVWLVKRKNYALSNLAAAILVKEGLLRTKDLVLYVYLMVQLHLHIPSSTSYPQLVQFVYVS